MSGIPSVLTTVALVVGTTGASALLASRLSDSAAEHESDRQMSVAERSPVLRGDMLVTDLEGSRELSVEVDGEDVLVRETRMIETQGLAKSPSYSPDGTRFAYMTSSDENTDILIGATDGSAPYLLTDTPTVRETGPAWSSDGRYVAYERTDESGHTDIWLADVTSREVQQVTSRRDFTYLSPTWAPETGHMAFVGRSRTTGTSDLYRYDTVSGETTPLTETPSVSEAQPAYAPDGETLVYTVSDDADMGVDPSEALLNTIYVLTPAAEPTQVEVTQGNYLFADWLSSDVLALVEFRTPGRVMAVPISNPKSVSTLWNGAGLATFDWSPTR